MPSIPLTRPVIWQDLEDIRLRNNLTQGDLCDFFGIPQAKWGEISKNKGGAKLTDVVKDVTVAILARIYDMHPDLMPQKKDEDLRVFYKDLNALKPERLSGSTKGKHILKRHFAVYLGRNSSAGYAWLDQGKPASPQVHRVIQAVQNATNAFELLEELTEVEARARGVDPFKNGNWAKKK